MMHGKKHERRRMIDLLSRLASVRSPRSNGASAARQFETLEARRLLSYATIVDLGTLAGGSTSFAEAINDSGQVAGYSDNGNGDNHAFLYSNGAMTDLGTLGGYANSYGFAINASGEVAGDSDNGIGTGDIDGLGFTSANGHMTQLNPLGGGGTFVDANAINSSGQVAGSSGVNYDEETHAVIFSGGSPSDLGTLGTLYSSSYAHGINDSGTAVGWVEVAVSGQAANQDRAFVYSGGGMSSLGTLGGLQSYAYAINNSGQIVGYSDTSTSGVENAFLYSNGTMTDLDTVNSGYSKALAINASGEAVGYAEPWASDAAGGGYASGNTLNIDAVSFYSGTMTDLNSLIDPSLGWTLESAQGVNASGQIVGYGVINGNTHAFLLTPASQSGAGFATLTSGNLLVEGTSGDDVITLQTDGSGNLTATLNGVTSQNFTVSQITSVDVEAGAGNDSVTIESSMPATLGVSVQGGPGDDTVVGGPGNDTIGGGAGNDSLSGGPGDDSIKGGAGDDTLAGGKGNDTLFGSLGNDLLRGGLGDDSLNGGAGTNQLYGGQGNNTFYCVNGTDDQIFAGAATNDSLIYGTNDNYIIESGAIAPGNITLA